MFGENHAAEAMCSERTAGGPFEKGREKIASPIEQGTFIAGRTGIVFAGFSIRARGQ
jgi:hypothetical protein